VWIIIGLTLVCAWLVRPSLKRKRGSYAPLFKGTGHHWRRNYGRRTFLRLGAGALAAGMLAYSGADEVVERFHTGTIRSTASDRISHVLHIFGDRFWFVNWLLVAGIDAWWHTNSWTSWGRKNFEALVVGLPTLWTVQRGLGANRPSSDNANPRWRPMAADNSASGHTFISAVPWLTLAKRCNVGPVKPLARLGSVLTGWSRMNDRKHYLSQVVLGWTIANNAVNAVADGVIEQGEDHDIQEQHGQEQHENSQIDK